MVYDRNKYNAQYQKEHYDVITILAPKGSKQFLKDYAKGNNTTVSRLVISSIEEYCNVNLDDNFNLKN